MMLTKTALLTLLMALSTSTLAAVIPEPRPNYVPVSADVARLAKVGSVTPSVWEEKTAQGLRLIRTGDDIEPEWMTEEDTWDLIRAKKGFFDITDTYHIRLELAAKEAAAGVKVNLEKRVTYPVVSSSTVAKSIVTSLSTANMQANLNTLTALNNRYYKSTTGAQATTIIYNKLVSIAGSTAGVTVTQFTHSWGQNSIIAKIAGSGTGPITIFGSHLDSINQASPTSGRAPGADDNGTGVVNLIEVFRALIAAGFKPVSTVEFHFYSAEEAGLLGSQAVAANYKAAGKSVKAMIQLDMTAYFKPGTAQIIALVDDYVTASLNTWLRTIISTYCAIPAGTDHCGYACTDNASWYDQGFPTANPFESTTANSNQNIHSASDTTSLTGFSWSHSLEFAKMIAGAAYHLGSV